MMFGPLHNSLGHFFAVLALHLDPGGYLGLSLSVTFHGELLRKKSGGLLLIKSSTHGIRHAAAPLP